MTSCSFNHMKSNRVLATSTLAQSLEGVPCFSSFFVCIRRFHLCKDNSVVLKSTKTCTLWSPDLAQHLLSASTIFFLPGKHCKILPCAIQALLLWIRWAQPGRCDAMKTGTSTVLLSCAEETGDTFLNFFFPFLCLLWKFVYFTFKN